MKVSQLLEATKGNWKISNLMGVDKTFKSEESPEARAWMRNKGPANQSWNGTEWVEKKTNFGKPKDLSAKWARDDAKYERQRERERTGKHLTHDDYADIYNVWMDAVGDSFPDGDPMDRIADYIKRNFPEVDTYHTTDLVDKALRKIGHGDERKGHYYNMERQWEGHALDTLFDINTMVERGKTLGQAIDDASMGNTFFRTEKGNLVMNENPWGKPNRKRYLADWKRRYPKISFAE